MRTTDATGRWGLEDTASGSLDGQLGFRLGRVHRIVREAWEERIAALDLTGPQAAALRAVGERHATGLRELARRLRTDPMNARRLVDHLERRGLVASAPDPDHRQRRAVRLTDAGARTCRVLAERGAAWEAELDGLLGRHELAQLRALLCQLEEALRGRATAWPRSPGASAPTGGRP